MAAAILSRVGCLPNQHIAALAHIVTNKSQAYPIFQGNSWLWSHQYINNVLKLYMYLYICLRFKPLPVNPLDDPISDYMNLLGMILSMCGLMMKVRSH